MSKTQEYKGFNTTKPVESLLPVEALALLNRWAKTRSYFYYDDIDRLYQVKDYYIARWLSSKELIPTAIIVRESPVVTKMKTALANEKCELEWLNDDSYEDYLTVEEKTCLGLIRSLSEEYFVAYPEEIYNNWMREFEPKLKAYNLAKQEYDAESKRRQPIVQDYNRALSQYKKDQETAAKNWAKENKIKVARSNSGKSLKKDWLNRLEKQGFKYEPAPPTDPFLASKIVKPIRPEYPPKTYAITFESYVPGAIAEIENALAWVRSLVAIDHPSNIDEDFVYVELQEALQEVVLKRIEREILEIFEKTIAGSYASPKDVYQALTSYEIDYESALDMSNYYDYRNHFTTHRDFSKWHEINFSPTGFWLIEFQSLIEPSITFHVPYNRKIAIDRDRLPKIESTQAKFGREINRQEKKLYPIEDLLKILDLSLEDFPYEFEKYERHTNYYYNDLFDDDDDDFSL